MSYPSILFSRNGFSVKSTESGSDLTSGDIVATVPLGYAWRITEMNVTNPGATDAHVWLQVFNGANKAFKVCNKLVAAGQTLTIGGDYPGMRIANGDSIAFATDDADGLVMISASGIVLDGATDYTQHKTLICASNMIENGGDPQAGGNLSPTYNTIATSGDWQIGELTLTNSIESECRVYLQLYYEENMSEIYIWKLCGVTIAAGETLTLNNLAIQSGVSILAAWGNNEGLHIVASGFESGE